MTQKDVFKMMNSGDGQDNSNDPLGSDDNSNVVPLKTPRKKITSSSKWAKKKPSGKTPPPSTPPSEPLINMPPYTKYLLGILIAIHLVVVFLLNEAQTHWVYIHLGFIPGRFTGAALFEPLALLTPFTHLLLHGSWLHLAMNTIMLLAFGAGIEKWIGGKKMIAFFILCGLFGMAAHFALNFNSYQPVIGASGGLSGLFAAALVMLNRRNGAMARGKYGLLPLIALWVGISVLFGMMGSPDGADIAWAAHVGGFLGGFAVLKWMKL
jgi:membrane associated rhomboid family serine protease